MLATLDAPSGLDQLRLASRRLRNDAAERDRLQDDPITYLSGLGIELNTETAQAVRHAGARTRPGAPNQAAAIHIDF